MAKNKSYFLSGAAAVIVTFTLVMSAQSAYAQFDGETFTDSGCCDIVNTYTPSATDYVNTYTSPATDFVNTYTPATTDYLNTYTPSATDYVNTYTPSATDYINTYTPSATDYINTYTPSATDYINTYTPPASTFTTSPVVSVPVVTTPSVYTYPSVVTSPSTFISPGFVGGGATEVVHPYIVNPVTVTQPGIVTQPAIISNPITYTNPGIVSSGYSYYNNQSYYNNYAAPTCYLSASQNYVNPGQSVTLYWSSNNASTGGYINGIGTVYATGSTVITPSQTTQFTGTFSGPAGTTNCYTTVAVYGSAVAPAQISLSQVPYTGLDLGPVGTALYWLFLILWCAIAAYLLAIKKIHLVLLTKTHAVLFGNTTQATHPAYAAVKTTPAYVPAAAPAMSVHAAAAPAPQPIMAAPAVAMAMPAPAPVSAPIAASTLPTFHMTDAIDPFILSQIEKISSR